MVLKKYVCLLVVILFSKNIFGQEWEAVSSIPDVNSHHAVGFSFMDKGYIVTGGDTTIATKKFFEYNSLTDTWTRKEDFPGEKRSYAIGDFYDGKQYLGFGANFASTTGNIYLNDFWSYDPVSDTWKQLASCPCTGRQHPSFNALNGKIYVGLGNDTTGDVDDFWAYDIETDTWSQKADFIGGKRHHPYHFTLGEYVYVGFGHNHNAYDVNNDWFRYDPENDSWYQLSDLPGEGRVAGTQLYHNGYGYALSGQGEDLTGGFHHPMDEGEFWRYNPETDTWDQLTSHPGESRFAPASFVIDGYAYLVSGIYADADLPQVMRIKLAPEVNSISDELNLDINIFPNPSSHYINILIDENRPLKIESLKITDLSGQVVLNINDYNNKPIDISGFNDATYYLSIKVDGIYHKKAFTKIEG